MRDQAPINSFFNARSSSALSINQETKKKENNSTLIIDRHDTHNTFKIKNCIIILSQYF